ncbi:NAD(+) diphosphatase [Dongia soli]|uniref:NAD(+) diphosphatase n=1 Tax=Dongia soli TaxID=600628 RepID=A0ABU5E6N1_9PROT|nr:NAD(+) diphosphatase [Dongia soli]MDY0881689.1 NAD(+) diphosphatase [Dongia soli]
MIDSSDSGVNFHALGFYATGDFDRCATIRQDTTWLVERLQDPYSLLHLVWRGRNLVVNADVPRAHFLPLRDHRDLIAAQTDIILLGRAGEATYFALDISGLDEESVIAFGEFAELRSIGQLTPQRDGALMAYARGLSHWHERHRFCGRCGSPTATEAAGHQRRCTNPACALQHFPRLDPAVIMRITHRHPQYGERILLARQANWSPGMHSVLAGFVETGETLEAAVARETYEEVGLRVENIRYFGSQPWPFPSSLMLGFTAEASDSNICLDLVELESARWLTKDQLRRSPENDDFRLPRADSISRRLIEDWVRD